MKDLKDQKEVMDQGVRQDRWERRGKLVLLDLLATPEVLGKRVTKDSKAQMVLLVPKEKEEDLEQLEKEGRLVQGGFVENVEEEEVKVFQDLKVIRVNLAHLVQLGSLALMVQ